MFVKVLVLCYSAYLFIRSLLYFRFSDSTCPYFLQILKDLSFLNGYFTIHEEFLQKVWIFTSSFKTSYQPVSF